MNQRERELWLEERRTGICGTDVAAILGLDQYKTPIMVWQDKKGLLNDSNENEAMRQGRDLEDYIANRFTEETGKRLYHPGHNWGNPKYPWALCNPDRLINKENAGLEIKLTSALNLKKFKNGEYPVRYYTQCVHNMAIIDTDYWYLAVLIALVEFKYFKIERDQKEIDTLMEFEREFWENYIVKDVMPPTDGKVITTQAINQMFMDNPLTAYAEFPDLLESCKEYKRISKLINEYTEAQEKIKQNIILQLKDTEKAGVNGQYKISFKAQTTRTLNRKAIEAKYPNIIKDETVWQERKTRPLRIDEVVSGKE